MKYQQLTSHDRYILGAMKKQGIAVQQIAKILGFHRSTIYREIERNSCHHTDGAYRPSKAERRTRARRSRSRRNRHYSDADFYLVRHFLRKKWSPEQIVGHIRRFGLMQRRMQFKGSVPLTSRLLASDIDLLLLNIGAKLWSQCLFCDQVDWATKKVFQVKLHPEITL